MNQVIRMGIGAHGQAAAAIGAHLTPVGIAGLGVDPPAQRTVVFASGSPRNGAAGTRGGALLADLAELDHGAVEAPCIRDQWQIG